MFAMVLAIGLLVDDAIVVVENVERVMREDGTDPHTATVKSMGQITGALVGIAMVLSAGAFRHHCTDIDAVALRQDLEAH